MKRPRSQRPILQIEKRQREIDTRLERFPIRLSLIGGPSYLLPEYVRILSKA